MKVCIITLGCKVNQYESDSLLFALEKLGYEVNTELCYADYYIINTCAVTNEAEKKSRQMVAKARSCNKNAKILVCGCASEKDSSQFERLENVTYIIGTENKTKIIENLESNGVDLSEQSLVYDDNYISKPTKTRAYVKIQDGCNNFCSYCIIPYLRGRSRSRDLESIVAEIDNLSKTTKEIILTGIDVSDYKINGERCLDIVLEKLLKYKENVRFRLSSLEQGVISEKFIEKAKQLNLCPHFHLSLQSGCDETLKRMNRKYKTNDFLNTIKSLRKHFKNPSITTDVIVGFPEESEQEFSKTLKFIKKAKFSNIHIFPYSMRSGTVATRYKQVDGNIKRKRVKKLEKIKNVLFARYIKKSKKQILKVLVEEKQGEFWVGHSENYIKCYLPFEVNQNEFVNVRIVRQYNDGAIVKKVCKKP